VKFKICLERQKILDAKGHILVTGGPGSGKTTIALKKALIKIEQGLHPGQSILFLSFSRAAVARILESAEKWVPKAILSLISVQTFHSFFWQILKTNGYLLGTPRKLQIFLPHDEKALSKGMKIENPGWPAWEKQREQLFFKDGCVAFDLFAPKTLEILDRCKSIATLLGNKYPLIIVDEAQDTDDHQWGCVKKFANCSQLLFLADLEQQIYDFRPGVSTERVMDILSDISPLRVDLGSQNNRSPGVEILKFGNDLLLDRPSKEGYKGLTRTTFSPNAQKRDMAIRGAVGRLINEIKKETGTPPHNIAFLTSWGKGVTIISNALRGNGEKKTIPHRVIFDEAIALLSSRVVAFLMEPKQKSNKSSDLATILDLLIEIENAKGNVTALKNAKQWQGYSEKIKRKEKYRAVKLTKAIINIFETLDGNFMQGNPKKDWLSVRRLLWDSNVKALQAVNSSVQYLMAFNRGKRISQGLAEAWKENTQYLKCREIIEKALTEEQLLSDDNESRGIHVMTLHKSKGKEFDGVIIFDESRISPLLYGDKEPPYYKSRKLFRVGITRAKTHVLLLTDRFTPTPLLAGFRL
jgi:DNA helicase-2/ATP-dependent DNA helicase PcrA